MCDKKLDRGGGGGGGGVRRYCADKRDMERTYIMYKGSLTCCYDIDLEADLLL